jgi:hypothetical protein
MEKKMAMLLMLVLVLSWCSLLQFQMVLVRVPYTRRARSLHYHSIPEDNQDMLHHISMWKL